MTFTRSVSGRSNMHSFLGVNYIVYSEGGAFDKAIGQSISSIDAIFWKGFFSRFLPDLSYSIRSLGSKENLLPYAKDVADEKITNTIVVMDRDHDHHRQCIISHPCVIYTCGYSWENDAWRAESVISKLERISVGGVSKEFADEVRIKCRNFFSDFNRLVFVDVLCSLERVQGIHRERYWSFVDSQDSSRLRVKKDAFKKLIATVKAGRVNKFKYAGSDRITSERDCYGKLLAKFVYEIFCKGFQTLTGQKNLSRAMADIFMAEHFQYMDLSRDPLIQKYYTEVAESLSVHLH